jgi:hypothetical protein
MTTAGVRAAALRPAFRPHPVRRVLSAGPWSGSFLESPVPATAMFAAAAVLLAGGTLPVVDGELVLAGLTTAVLATLVARLLPPPSPAGRPVVQTSRSSVSRAGSSVHLSG